MLGTVLHVSTDVEWCLHLYKDLDTCRNFTELDVQEPTELELLAVRYNLSDTAKRCLCKDKT